MTSYVLAFDPGKSSGVALLKYGPDLPATLVHGWQFGGGIEGLVEWLDRHIDLDSEGFPWLETGDLYFRVAQNQGTVISEKFTPIPGRGFSQGLDSTLPLVGEGVLIGRGVLPPYEPGNKQWQRPSQMYIFGGKGLAEKKKIARAKLKEFDLYLRPRELGTPDSDDFLSATLHALYFITHTVKHKPTYEAYLEHK